VACHNVQKEKRGGVKSTNGPGPQGRRDSFEKGRQPTKAIGDECQKKKKGTKTLTCRGGLKKKLETTRRRKNAGLTGPRKRKSE